MVEADHLDGLGDGADGYAAGVVADGVGGGEDLGHHGDVFLHEVGELGDGDLDGFGRESLDELYELREAGGLPRVHARGDLLDGAGGKGCLRWVRHPTGKMNREGCDASA